MNELCSLLKRSIEGLGYQQGEYEDAAAAVVWLEARGMNGLEMIATAWPRLECGAENRIALTNNSDGIPTLDANECSIAFCGRVAADLALAATDESNISRIEIRHGQDCIAIFPSLDFFTTHDLYAIAHWYKNGVLHIGVAQPQQAGCDYYCIETPDNDVVKRETLSICCSRDGKKILAMAFELAGDDSDYRNGIKVHSSDMQAHYNRAIANGMTVNAGTVNMLTAAADRVLVEATEQSRLGAGE
jgi:LDH2 family malate/lactate/ureidoglycolate dehydrogenase